MIIVSFTEREFLGSKFYSWDEYCESKVREIAVDFLLLCGGSRIDVAISIVGHFKHSASFRMSLGIVTYQAAASILWKNSDVVRSVTITRHIAGDSKITLDIRLSGEIL